MFRHLGRALSWRSRGGHDQLLRTCALHQRHLLHGTHGVHPQGRAAEQPATQAVPPGAHVQCQHWARRHAHRQPAEPHHLRPEWHPPRHAHRFRRQRRRPALPLLEPTRRRRQALLLLLLSAVHGGSGSMAKMSCVATLLSGRGKKHRKVADTTKVGCNEFPKVRPQVDADTFPPVAMAHKGGDQPGDKASTKRELECHVAKKSAGSHDGDVEKGASPEQGTMRNCAH
jgi:hypothetical protein